MKLAVFSDIHGNLEALQTFMKHVSSKGVDRFVCLGDIVGYGANPGECIKLVRNFPNLIIIQGNHDAAVSWDSSPYMMSENAKKAILWSMEILSEEDKKYLTELPLTYRFNNISFSHANPYNPKAWRYVNNRKYALRSFGGCKDKMLFVGHTHTPLVITRLNFLQVKMHKPEPETPIPVDKHKRQIFNCGSVGQPRTGSPDLNYLVYDTRKATVTYYKVPYDHNQAGHKILSAGLPKALARRLIRGV